MLRAVQRTFSVAAVPAAYALSSSSCCLEVSVLGAAENTRRIHASVVVALCRSKEAEPALEQGIEQALDRYCDTIRNGPDELADADVEALRFLTSLRTELNGGDEAAGGE